MIRKLLNGDIDKTYQTPCGTIHYWSNILRTFEQRVASWHGEFVESMSVSYGYVFSSERMWNSILDISKASDERMYESKKQYYARCGMDRRRR